MLDNRNKDGHFLKDFHYYNADDNLWNALARAAPKTMNFFHTDHLRWNAELARKKAAEKSSANNVHFRQQKDTFETRRATDDQTFKQRKLERLVLQEVAGQPVDHRFERDLEERIHSLHTEDAEKIVLKRSAVHKTLSATGGAPNVWNDHSKLTEKQTKLLYPKPVISKDELAAKMIYERIVQDEAKADQKNQERKEKAEQIKKEVAHIISTKNAACYSRPSSALTTNTPRYKPSNPSRQDSANPPASHRPMSAFRLSSAKFGSSCSSEHVPVSNRVCSKHKDSAGTIPLDKYSEFQGLLVTKINKLNTKCDMAPFANILMTSSDLVKETLDSQRLSSARTLSRPGTARTFIKDPRAKYPDKPKDPKYSNIPLDDNGYVHTELEKFEDHFDPRLLEMGTKFYKLYPVANTPAEMGKPPANLAKKAPVSQQATSLQTLHLSSSDAAVGGVHKKQLKYVPRINSGQKTASSPKLQVPATQFSSKALLNRDVSALIRLSDLSESKPVLLMSDDEARERADLVENLLRKDYQAQEIPSPVQVRTNTEQKNKESPVSADQPETKPSEAEVKPKIRPTTAREPRVKMRRDKPVNPFQGRTVRLGGKYYETVEVMNLQGYGPHEDSDDSGNH